MHRNRRHQEPLDVLANGNRLDVLANRDHGRDFDIALLDRFRDLFLLGEIDLSIGSTLSLASVVAALAMRATDSVWLGAAAGIGTGRRQ